MKLLRLLSCAWLVLLVSAAEPPIVGPQKTETENGDEVWKTKLRADGDVLTHKVNDLGKRDARPKIVYNCALVPALCKNARKYLNGKSKATMHYDYDELKKRKKGRRDNSCPGNWIKNGRCPESDQPSDYWFTREEESPLEKKEIHMWRGKDGNSEPDPSHFAEVRVKRAQDGTEIRRWSKFGAQFTCDEWPAASWIEGGEGANTYCAPQRSTCKGVTKVNTEQDFQAQAHGQINNWYDKFYPQWPRNEAGTEEENPPHDLNYQIFKFDFELVSNGGSKYATWVEALGRKRYCFPKAADMSDCKTVWDEDPDDLFDRRA
ncbi:hypothetical protein BJX61DRAFT_539524 [Aspergillus egyptiacus]|nr:hypothetical protein BJX61DRAFT_539524 [Aspergillus egyptiacus]